MLDPAELLNQVRAAEAAGDPDRVDELRASYLEVAPSSPETTDIRYRHGLSRLFRHQDVDGAMALFKEAAQDKSADIAPEARISYALCLNTKAKRQQAIFELRKLLPQGAKPTMHTAQALDFLSLLLRESGAQETDIDKVDTQRVDHLSALADEAGDPMERSHWWLRLAAAYADAGTSSDIGKARETLQKIIKLGKGAGDSALKAARASLKTLPR
jgi:TPR repeat protein